MVSDVSDTVLIMVVSFEPFFVEDFGFSHSSEADHGFLDLHKVLDHLDSGSFSELNYRDVYSHEVFQQLVKQEQEDNREN